jgi:hypothetical protein
VLVIANDPIPRHIAAVWVLVITDGPIRGATPALWVLVITSDLCNQLSAELAYDASKAR